MSMLKNIKAALKHLQTIAGELERGIEHDAERMAGDVRDLIHLGYAKMTSRRDGGKSFADAQAAADEAVAAEKAAADQAAAEKEAADKAAAEKAAADQAAAEKEAADKAAADQAAAAAGAGAK